MGDRSRRVTTRISADRQRLLRKEHHEWEKVKDAGEEDSRIGQAATSVVETMVEEARDEWTPTREVETEDTGVCDAGRAVSGRGFEEWECCEAIWHSLGGGASDTGRPVLRRR
jgi:hypothetical protein